MSQGEGTLITLLDAAKKRPVASGLTLAGAAGAVILLMNVMPGLELMVRIKKAPDVAEAALQKAEDARQWIDAYIKDQQTQREVDQKLAEQATEYQRQILELQRQQVQQQVPNQVPSIPDPWEFIKEEGDWQVFRNPDGKLMCCDGTTCIPKPKRGRCR